ncbi:MAG: lactate racemase domain-containing protein [Planctomycetales bacterium]
MQFPRVLRLRQKFDAPRVMDVAAEVEHQLSRLELHQKVKKWDTVAVTVGSRGIANIAIITRAIVEHLKKIGTKPFIVPAMGSHGGGTADGQRRIIEEYGVTEECVGAPIFSSMETVIVDHTPQGVPVHFDKHAFGADHVVVAGRIKPHTNFVGDIESGLHKMMLIGLGKHEGAKIYHRAIMDLSWPEIALSVSSSVLKKCKILCGVGIVENAYDQTGLIEAVPPQQFFDRERELLKTATAWLPRLPFKNIDMLVIDEIGKNISGSGMDTNVVGRKFNDHRATPKDNVNCRVIFVRGLTAETHGNACGIGIAEFTNQRTVDSIDRRITNINCITGGHAPAGMIPMAFETDRDVLTNCFPMIGLTEPPQSKLVQIANTLHLEEVIVSEAYLPEIRTRSDLEILSEPDEMTFDLDGNLLPVMRH